jgi:hypothetical protein
MVTAETVLDGRMRKLKTFALLLPFSNVANRPSQALLESLMQ